MPRLFSYGSLQQPQVQLATFERLLAGERDELAGFDLQTIHRGNRPLSSLRRSVGAAGRVAGMVFEVTEQELLMADVYERADDYVRRLVTLSSGVTAWVYLDSGMAD